MWESLRSRHRVFSSILAHAVIFSISLLASYLIWLDVRESSGIQGWLRHFLRWLPYFVVVKMVIFWRMRLLRGGWRYSGIRDVARILTAAWIFVFVTLALVMIFTWLPRKFDRKVLGLTDYFGGRSGGILVLDFLATVFLASTARLGFRIYREEMRPISTEGLRRVLVVGAGNAAESILREILRMRVERYRVMGLVDDDPDKRGLMIHGVPVLGTTRDIKPICEELKIDEIIIAIPSATQKQLRRVIEQCGGTKLKFQSLPGVGDLVEGRVTVSQIRPVDINDLLGRQAVELDLDAIGRFLKDRRVLVTGAGGSIGSEMCRQICKFAPAHLVLVEQAETPLFDIENELRAGRHGTPLTAVICDIADRARVMQVWRQFRPQVVIHAAAHKHVPMMERNPGEAIKNNVLGSRNVADASCEVACDEFVTISTDKAVNPSSIMGATKRVVEMYTQALSGSGHCPTQFKAVRFGNVLDSAGSVVPTFRRQIAAGGPVTVTHPEMTRYFMTISEASQLVLQAAATGRGGQIFLLDMGEPVKIVDLARQMITLSGFRPGEDIDVVFTGVRPGEKLFEELRTVGEDIEPTVHPKVLIWKRKPEHWDRVQEAVRNLEALVADPAEPPSRQAVVAALRGIIPEYAPQDHAPPADAGASLPAKA
jgi:FlaA1/EpsC-like NDP-sugar epimerase